jgi:hypothetical protein
MNGKPDYGEGYRDGRELGYKAGLNADRWISVEDEMPDGQSSVVVYAQYDEASLVLNAYYNGVCFTNNGGVFNEKVITHWQPLPAPPKETK